MDYKFYEELLNKMISHIYGNRISVDEKGIFEWSKMEDGTISYRSIKKLHRFEVPKKKETKNENKGKVIYLSLKNSFYITEISPENTFEIYSVGGGMTERYMFKKTDSKIEIIEKKVITIR